MPALPAMTTLDPLLGPIRGRRATARPPCTKLAPERQVAAMVPFSRSIQGVEVMRSSIQPRITPL